MANAPGGSFIPKRSTGKVTPVRSGKRIYVFSYVAYVLFFGTLLSVVGIFFLNQQAENNLQEFIVRVNEAQESVNQNQINSIRQLDTRILAAEKILDMHAAPSRLFAELESVILESIQLTSFSYVRGSNGGGIELSFGGTTETFDGLLFQRDVMEASSILSTADIVEVNFGAGGTEVIEGPNRGAAENPGLLGETKITFTFDSDSILNNIGYLPISNDIPDEDEITTGFSPDEVSPEEESNVIEP